MAHSENLGQAIPSVSEDFLKQISPVEHQNIDDLISRINSGLGPFFYLFYHYHTKEILHISKQCEEFTGYPSSTWYERGPALFTDHLAPETKQEMKRQSNICWQKLKNISGKTRIRSSITFMYTVQLKKQFRHFLDQHIVVTTGEEGDIKLCLAVFTDITHLKEVTDHKHVLSSVSIPGSQKHFVYNTVTKQLINLNKLTTREKQVLAGYGSGKHTERIADELSISPYTVQTHRSKLLGKTGCNNLAELIHFARINSIL
ncbi:helix-turn-helix transcriptional regulator [Gracilimonas sp. Q87]|uniref:helix-turn-helix transcriptional regulator n=1 Tax=Gracilimonas sp. Q87 TaxID=3384766 RepID=UPI00398441F0